MGIAASFAASVSDRGGDEEDGAEGEQVGAQLGGGEALRVVDDRRRQRAHRLEEEVPAVGRVGREGDRARGHGERDRLAQARPIASVVPATSAGRMAASETRRATRQLSQPSAVAPSRHGVGTARSASAKIEIISGAIITVSTMIPSSTLAPVSVTTGRVLLDARRVEQRGVDPWRADEDREEAVDRPTASPPAGDHGLQDRDQRARRELGHEDGAEQRERDARSPIAPPVVSSVPSDERPGPQVLAAAAEGLGQLRVRR